MNLRRAGRSWAVVVSAIVGLAAACDNGVSPQGAVNQPPQVWLAAAPPEGSTTRYDVRLYWGGWDPDGEIDHYEFLVTDNRAGVFDPTDLENGVWAPVYRNDSLFTFTADQLADSLTTRQASVFTRSHTFFIRAVDLEGAMSEEPAHRSFTARTLSPEVVVDVPPRQTLGTAQLPPVATYRWRAYDYVDSRNDVQDPDSVQWALEPTRKHAGSYTQTIAYLRTPASRPSWQPWVCYTAPDDSGTTWTTPPMPFGDYVFAVRAKDDAGAVTPVLDEKYNVRRVIVSTRTTGPTFTLANPYLGALQTATCESALKILDIPAGVPLAFTLRANADWYGGEVVGYRYGWDIADLTDPAQWEIDYTPFIATEATTPGRAFYMGTHIFSAEVIDNSGNCSRIEVKINTVQFTMERDLLIVDDFKQDERPGMGWDDPNFRGIYPSQAEHEQFWLDMVSDLDGFDPERDIISATRAGANIPLSKLADYKSIVWSTIGNPGERTDLAYLYKFIMYRPRDPTDTSPQKAAKLIPNLLALTMAVGGHVMITGEQPLQYCVNRETAPYVRYPLIFLYEPDGLQTGLPDDKGVEDAPGSESFAYREMCLDVIDFVYLSVGARRSPAQGCSVKWLYDYNRRDDTLRGAFALDPAFPHLTLRPEAAGEGKAHQPSESGIYSEVYNPQYFKDLCPRVPRTARACFQPIYGLECLNTSQPTYHQPVAFWTSAYADRVANVPGAVAARSCAFGFAPVFMNPGQFKQAMDVIMFDEWKLPRKPAVTTSR